MRRLDIGIASYGAPEKLDRTIESLRANCQTDWHLYIVNNPHRDEFVKTATDIVIRKQIEKGRCSVEEMETNVGYVGAVNLLMSVLSETDYVAYCDNDIEIHTPGWDEAMISVMEQNPEVGWTFPGSGHYGFHNGKYDECLWSAGFCWIMRRDAMLRVAVNRTAADGSRYFDPTLGHHEEVDYMIRMRLDGWRIACAPDVRVAHHETATRADSADHKPGGRIHDGVVRWMNKWNRYFCGNDLRYSMTEYDSRALRYTDWNVDALYLERMTLKYFPQLNANPETVNVPGVGPMDVIKVLKPKGCYANRAI